METNLMAEKARIKFETGPGQMVDVLYADSSGNLFFEYDEVEQAASKLENKSITSYYRDPKVRNLAKQYKKLEEMVFATDFIKTHRITRTLPDYDRYILRASKAQIGAVNREIFKFIESKVFRAKKPTTAGMRDQIYMMDRGIVDAIFLRRYPQGQIWQVGDTLVMTCPTNTELTSGTYKQIFTPLLGEE
jgi:hypothetical protein